MSTVTTTMSTTRKKRTGPVLAIAALLGMAALLGVRVKETLAERATMQTPGGASADQARAREPSATVRGKPVKWLPMVQLTGTLTPIQEADLGFKVPGRLQSVRVNEGDMVRAGQVLASLECAEASAQAQGARAAIRAAEAGLAMATDAETRTEALFATNVVNESDRIGVKQRRALAAADLDRARAQAELAGAGVSSCTLSAPFAGLVTRVPAGVGKIVSPGEPLFHVQDVSVLELRATISEQDRRIVEVGGELRLDSTDGSAPRPDSAGEAGPRAASQGRITAVLPSLDPQTRRVPVLAEVPNGGPTPLLAGAFVRAEVGAKRELEVLELPAATLRPGSQDEVVIREGAKLRRARLVFSLGRDGTLLVRSGLSATDDVLLEPSAEARDGDDAVPHAAVPPTAVPHASAAAAAVAPAAPAARSVAH